MAKYESKMAGSFNDFLSYMEREIINGSITARLEAKSNISLENVNVAIRVFERYSVMSGNRVGLNLTLVGNEENLFLTMITSGGSGGMFLTYNSVGEESFLVKAIEAVNRYGK